MFIECFIKIYSTCTKTADPSLLGVCTPYVTVQTNSSPPNLHCLADL